MAHIERLISKLVTFLLRLAAVAYLLVTLYPYIVEPGFEGNFANWALRWVLIILIAAAALAAFVLKRSDFLVYGFFVVLIAALFQLFISLTNELSITGLLLHFYVLATASYFISRDFRVHAHSREKRKKRTN